MDLARNNLQCLICHKPNPTKPNQTKINCKILGGVQENTSCIPYR